MIDEDTDNVLEDYFFELLISKHATDKEIHDLRIVIESCHLAPEYQLQLKNILFWEDNLYMQNWGTLQASLHDIAHNNELRDGKIETHGVILEALFRMIEYIFDIDDSHMLAFIMSHHKEDVERKIIILMKRILDYFEDGLWELVQKDEWLTESPEEGEEKHSFVMMKKLLLQFPQEILDTQKGIMDELKHLVDSVGIDLEKRQKTNLS